MPSELLPLQLGQLRRQAQPCRLLHEHRVTMRRPGCAARGRRPISRPDLRSSRRTSVTTCTPARRRATQRPRRKPAIPGCRTFLPKLLSSSQYTAGNTVIFVTWDEDDYSSSNANRIATIVLSPSTPAGAKVTTRYDHYSMLRTTEELLGLPFIGNASRRRQHGGRFPSQVRLSRTRAYTRTRSRTGARYRARSCVSAWIALAVCSILLAWLVGGRGNGAPQGRRPVNSEPSDAVRPSTAWRHTDSAEPRGRQFRLPLESAVRSQAPVRSPSLPSVASRAPTY